MFDRDDHPLAPKRRWFLKTVVAIGAVGSALGGLVYWHRGMSNGQVTPHGRAVLNGLARGIVGPQLPADPVARQAVLDAHIVRVEAFLDGMPMALRTQVNSVLGLLSNAPTRLMLTGLRKPWEQANDAEIADALESMRIKALPSTQLIYHVVRDVTCMAFFSNSDNWNLSGYPGPVQI